MPRIDQFVGEYRFLSNFAEVSHGVYGYRTNEHFFQAMKTTDLVRRDQIKRCMTPGQAKRMGRHVILREDWEAIKDEVMITGLRAKFKPGTMLAASLVTTHPAELVEGNHWHDNYWGNCDCGTAYQCRKDKPGRNKLGIMLMIVRNELLAGPEATVHGMG